MVVCAPLKIYVHALSNDLVSPGTAPTVPPCLNVALLCNVKVPETVNAKVEASSVPPVFTVQFITVGEISSVTTCVFAIIASSADPGTTPPTHVVVVFQVPVCALVITVPHAVWLENTTNAIMAAKNERWLFIKVSFRVMISG